MIGVETSEDKKGNEEVEDVVDVHSSKQMPIFLFQVDNPDFMVYFSFNVLARNSHSPRKGLSLFCLHASNKMININKLNDDSIDELALNIL